MFRGSGDVFNLSDFCSILDSSYNNIIINTSYFVSLLNTSSVKEAIGILPSESVETKFGIMFELDLTLTYVVDS